MSFDPDLYRRTLRLAGRGQNGQDLNLSVIDAGPRDALRTIVFLHGMGGYAGYWHHQLNHFYEGSRVIAPDLRGHGLSDAPISTYSRDELLGDIEAVLALLDVPTQFILVTHSF
ncbi:MAG TPA: alpha/beta fold hydrolase, partial [Burkholderiaceae bacterium]|nr:alpha/beta fold hydrolase [Burkholderiaceae bacterium]